VTTGLAKLGTPFNFHADWYGHLTNQMSHVGLGMFATWMACVMAFSASGELPYRYQVWIGLAFIYALKEVLWDGWYGFDTIEDFMFVVVYGSGGTLLAFKEIDPQSSDVVFNIYSALPVLSICVLQLALGVYVRMRQANGTPS